MDMALFVMTCFICVRVSNFLLNSPAWDLSFYLRRRSEYLPDIILTSLFPRNNFRASSRMYCLSTSVSAAVVACQCRANRKIRRYNDRTSLLNIGSTSFAFYKWRSWRKILNIILLAKSNTNNQKNTPCIATPTGSFFLKLLNDIRIHIHHCEVYP